MIHFTVFGKAQPAGSKRAFALTRRDGSPVLRENGSQVVSVTDANPNSRDWKNSVRAAARAAYGGELLDGALALHLDFYQPRPAGHFAKHGLSKAGREKPYPTGKPDVLKLARGVEDALSGVLYRDDAQIVDEVLTKRYGEPARVEVFLWETLLPNETQTTTFTSDSIHSRNVQHAHNTK